MKENVAFDAAVHRATAPGTPGRRDPVMTEASAREGATRGTWIPLMGGTAGLPPVAITAVANLRILPLTSMASGLINLPLPCRRRQHRLVRQQQRHRIPFGNPQIRPMELPRLSTAAVGYLKHIDSQFGKSLCRVVWSNLSSKLAHALHHLQPAQEDRQVVASGSARSNPFG